MLGEEVVESKNIIERNVAKSYGDGNEDTDASYGTNQAKVKRQFSWHLNETTFFRFSTISGILVMMNDTDAQDDDDSLDGLEDFFLVSLD